jgi:hypothetical protein
VCPAHFDGNAVAMMITNAEPAVDAHERVCSWPILRQRRGSGDYKCRACSWRTSGVCLLDSNGSAVAALKRESAVGARVVAPSVSGQAASRLC